MSIFAWLGGRFSCRGRAMSLYQRGMTRARRRDHPGAIAAYSQGLAMPDAPADVRAMLLFQRALTHFASEDVGRCADDLVTVLAMEEAPLNYKTMCRKRLAALKS